LGTERLKNNTPTLLNVGLARGPLFQLGGPWSVAHFLAVEKARKAASRKHIKSLDLLTRAT
jgi:hypothetical protein